MDFEFNSKIDAFVGSIKQTIHIKWGVKVDASKWGLRMTPIVPDQVLNVKVEKETEDGDYDDRYEDFEIKNANLSINDSDLLDPHSLGLYIQDVMIDVEEKRTDIIFGVKVD